MESKTIDPRLADKELMTPAPEAEGEAISPLDRTRSVYRKRWGFVLGVVSVSALLVLWEAAVTLHLLDEFVASKPSAVAGAGFHLLASGVILQEIGFTALGFALGFGLAVLIGVPLGILVGWYRTLYALAYPYIAAMNATPRIALYPLFVVWFGIGQETKVVIVLIASLLPVLFSTITGVRSLDNSFIEVARCMGANDRQIFRTVALPASVPFIMTGLRLGLGQGLLAIIVAELFLGNTGLGSLLNTYATYFQTARLMFVILLVATIGMVLLQVVQWVERKVDFWRPRV